MSIGSWFAGVVTDADQFLANAESPLQTMLANLGATVSSEFRDALGFFAADVFAKVEALIKAELAKVEGQLATDPIGAIATAAQAVVSALPTIGVQVGAQAILNMASALAARMSSSTTGASAGASTAA
jgi:hypothetical protein